MFSSPFCILIFFCLKLRNDGSPLRNIVFGS